MTERAFKFRFYPTTEQELLLRRTLGCVRLVYNRALAVRTEGWYSRQERIDYIKTSSLLTQWKKQEDLQFLNEVSCVPLQQGLRHLQKAFSNFFAGRSKYPNFKKKRSGGSAEFTKSAFKWKDMEVDLGEDSPRHTSGQLWLAKCNDALPIRWSRTLPNGSEPSTVTVKLDASGRWFVSILVDDHSIKALPQTDKIVGIDAGITSLITTSDGEKIVNPKHFKSLLCKLRLAQKRLSRRVKGSNNREKARREVARIQAAIADARKDFLHKLTTRLVRENQMIAVEDLAVKNMLKNRKLSQAIADASWSELVRQLEYKCQWYGEQRVAGVPPVVATANPKGRTLVKIDRWFPSSKRCGHCGHIVESLPLSIREWNCPKCGTCHERDINAAKNILAVGHTVLSSDAGKVCGANVRPDGHKSKGQLRNTRKGQKQKPKS